MERSEYDDPNLGPACASIIHHRRARNFLELAERSEKIPASSPYTYSAFIGAAVHSALAAFEFLAQWKTQDSADATLDEIKSRLKSIIHNFKTVESLHLQDFHRYPVHYMPGVSIRIDPFRQDATKQQKDHASAVHVKGSKAESKQGDKSEAERPIGVSGKEVFSSSDLEMKPVVEIIHEFLWDINQFFPKKEIATVTPEKTAKGSRSKARLKKKTPEKSTRFQRLNNSEAI